MLPPFDPWLTARIALDAAATPHAGAQALADLRARRLADLLRAAVRGSAFYRRRFRGVETSRVRLEELPVVRKAELMGAFDDWVADPVLRLDALRRFTADRSRIADPFAERYVVWESSGSSGEPGIFVQDTYAMAVYDALEFLRRPAGRSIERLMNPWGLGERMAFIGATGGHFASTVSIERLRRLNPALSLSLRSISFLQPPEALAAELDDLRPTVVATYPSVALLLAEERMAGRLHAVPREIWTGGENLSATRRGFVAQALGCAVVNSYGASEFLTLASECRQGRLHLNSDWAILESVDAQGRAVPPGERGANTLLTNLANHVQPLIRYELGDRVRQSAEPCPCGSALPVIEVEGRNDDALRLGRPGGRAVRVSPLAVCTVLEDDAGLFDFQLVQQGPCELLLRTGMQGQAADASLRRARTALSAFLLRMGADGVQIRCRSGVREGRGASGKVQRVLVAPT
ncbi:Phenylacetate-coenzyme A ligase [Variovorax sp. PBS-H4]|uniref:phenylacetate--CoA ligase family protein n=1 Tax=Variovorax sp. PBS-H4 TaxID=434008 RepID=UPI0013189358|nr:Phenylacetate-coenzyme A ligase [Variovorax sp. PBS-H4]